MSSRLHFVGGMRFLDRPRERRSQPRDRRPHHTEEVRMHHASTKRGTAHTQVVSA